MTHAYICDAIRTPFGRYGGALSSIRTDDLGALPLKALMARKAAIDPETERRLRAEIQHTGPYEHKGAQAQE